jgi:hypothetical protein
MKGQLQTEVPLFWLDAPCLRAVVAEREQGVYRRFSSIPRCRPARWGTKNASMPLPKSMVPEGVGDALVGGIGLLVDAVRVDLQQDRDPVPGPVGHLGREHPRCSVTAAADSKTTVRPPWVRRSAQSARSRAR